MITADAARQMARELGEMADHLLRVANTIDRIQDDLPVSTSLADLRLTVRSEKALRSAGITTASQLVLCSATHLMSLRKFGEGSLRDVVSCLRRHGLRLADR